MDLVVLPQPRRPPRRPPAISDQTSLLYWLTRRWDYNASHGLQQVSQSTDSPFSSPRHRAETIQIGTRRGPIAAVTVWRLLTTTMSSTAWVAVLATVILLFLQPSNGTIESNRFSGKAPLLDDSSALTTLSRLQRFATWRRPSEPLMQTLCCPSDVR